MLDERERAQLAMELIQSLDDETVEDDFEVAEARRCVELLDRGEMATISAEDLHAGMPLPDEP